MANSGSAIIFSISALSFAGSESASIIDAMSPPPPSSPRASVRPAVGVGMRLRLGLRVRMRMGVRVGAEVRFELCPKLKFGLRARARFAFTFDND